MSARAHAATVAPVAESPLVAVAVTPAADLAAVAMAVAPAAELPALAIADASVAELPVVAPAVTPLGERPAVATLGDGGCGAASARFDALSRATSENAASTSAAAARTPHRRGRERFAAAKSVLVAMSALFGKMPRPVAVLAATLARRVPTELGIALRWSLVRRLAAGCGDCVAIHDGVYLFALERAVFGTNVSVHPLCYLDATGGLTIGNDVSIAHGVSILTTEHDWTVPGIATRDAAVTNAAVTIGDDVWIGAGARILAGVTIGAHAVVGAGAVVTCDVAPHAIVGGVPARPLRQRTTQAGS